MSADARSDGFAPQSAPEHLVYTITRLSRALNRAMDDIAARHGITVPELMMLLVLGEGVGLSHAQLARRTFVTPQAGHQVAVSLAERGLVDRHAHPSNRRVRIATLSTEGARVLASCRLDLEELETRVVQPMGARGRTIVADLGTIADHLRGGWFGDEDAEAASARRRASGERRPLLSSEISRSNDVRPRGSLDPIVALRLEPDPPASDPA